MNSPVVYAETSYDMLRTLRLQPANLYVRSQPCPLIFSQAVPASKQVSLICSLDLSVDLVTHVCVRCRVVCATAEVGAGGRADAIPSRLKRVLKSVKNSL